VQALVTFCLSCASIRDESIVHGIHSTHHHKIMRKCPFAMISLTTRIAIHSRSDHRNPNFLAAQSDRTWCLSTSSSLHVSKSYWNGSHFKRQKTLAVFAE
jgi:hypothetical protein